MPLDPIAGETRAIGGEGRREVTDGHRQRGVFEVTSLELTLQREGRRLDGLERPRQGPVEIDAAPQAGNPGGGRGLGRQQTLQPRRQIERLYMAGQGKAAVGSQLTFEIGPFE